MKKGLIVNIFFLILIFTLSSCLIYEVDQPATVAAGGTFTTTVSISDITAESNNAHKGAICVLVPDDWTFTSGTYDSDVGTGTIVLDPAAATPVYGLIDTVIVPPANMKWVKLLSDVGYLHEANVYHDATLNFTVGQKGGDFPIGYMVTVNSGGMFDYFADNDIDDAGSSGWGDGVDTLMNQWVEITGGIVGVDKGVLAKEYGLSQNYPNPFNPETVIEYSLEAASRVELSVYDITGRLISTLVNEVQQPDNYQVVFHVDNLASGTYLYRLKTDNQVETRKMILLQ
ncbi:MAG: T9SS type A sorting domain-containing protein [Candidatus Neomarinimicrobiota bacterium]